MTAKKTEELEIRPLDDRIVVEPLEGEDKTPGGIYLPDTAKEKPQRGKVVAVGPGKTLENGERADMCVEPGDTILFAKFGGTEVEVEGRELIILRESDLLAIVED